LLARYQFSGGGAAKLSGNALALQQEKHTNNQEILAKSCNDRAGTGGGATFSECAMLYTQNYFKFRICNQFLKANFEEETKMPDAGGMPSENFVRGREESIISFAC
jgi:hypothetical protein